jgi:hemerythrin
VNRFEWQQIYSVGDANIDQQHRRLFEIANRFSEAYEKRLGLPVLSNIFNELVDYTVVHFDDEERLLRDRGYPEFDQHKDNHERLKKLVQVYVDQFQQNVEGIEERAMGFISTWLNGHILGMDKKYQSYLQ